MATGLHEEMVEFQFPDEKEQQGVSKEKQSAGDDAIEIQVVDDTPEPDRNRKVSEPPDDPSEDELNSYSQDARKRIKHFTKGYHDERRAKESAARERDEAVRLAHLALEENKRLKSTLNEGHTALLSTTRTAVEAEVAEARRALVAAQEAFDPEASALAQEKLFDAKIKLDRVNSFKAPPVQDDKKELQTQATPQRNQIQPDQKALAWQQRNQWFGTDDEMTAYVLGLHKKLVADGVDPRSDDYYQRLDARVKKLFPENFEGSSADDADTRTRRSVVAPATRSTAPKKIVLTQTQVQLAKRLGVPLVEYAKQVALEQRKQND